MRQPKFNLSANDNAPLRARQSSLAFKTLQKQKTEKLTTSSSPSNVIEEHKRKIILAWAVPVLALTLAVFAVLQNAGLSSLVWPSLIMAFTLLWTSTSAERHSRLRNISALMFVGAATLAAAGTLSHNGFPLIGVELALLVSIFSLFVGWALTSRPTLLLSIISTLGYLASLFPDLGLLTGLTEEHSQIGIAIIPSLLIGHGILAQRLRSYIMITLTILAAGVWVLAVANDLPVHALAGLGFALAAAHYSMGKTWETANSFGSKIHSVFGLSVALVAALYIQSLWMQFDSNQAQPIWSANKFWWSALALSIFAILVSSLIRFKSSQISLPGIFIISLGVTLIPLATAKPNLIESAFYNIPGLDAYPGMGLIIGAAIISCCLNWIVSGLKKGQFHIVLIGTIAIGVESAILYRPAYFNMDFGVIFIMSLICALCIGGLIAGSTSGQTETL